MVVLNHCHVCRMMFTLAAHHHSRNECTSFLLVDESEATDRLTMLLAIKGLRKVSKSIPLIEVCFLSFTEYVPSTNFGHDALLAIQLEHQMVCVLLYVHTMCTVYAWAASFHPLSSCKFAQTCRSRALSCPERPYSTNRPNWRRKICPDETFAALRTYKEQNPKLCNFSIQSLNAMVLREVCMPFQAGQNGRHGVILALMGRLRNMCHLAILCNMQLLVMILH